MKKLGGKKFAFIILLIGFFSILLFMIFPHYLFLTRTLKISPIKTLFSLDSPHTYDDKIAILILGIAGGNHDGPNLTDSITVVSYNLKTNSLVTISVPRDIWSDTLKDKINSAYAYGEAKLQGGGLKLAKAEIQAVVGIPVQYGAVVDFEKFRELIDFLGGVDVKVERSFTDSDYPISGKENDTCSGDPQYRCRYETVSFNEGLAHMDGTTALKYVRSRHAQGAEGNDFARNKRQQKIFQSVKTKLITLLKKFDITTFEKLYGVLNQGITRDISNQQTAILFKNMILKGNLSQKQITLDQDFFTVPDFSGYNEQYVLTPKTGNFDEIHLFVQKSVSK